MRTILATGGNGFIGSHTCLSLLQKNYNVVIVDSLINSHEETFNQVNKIFQLSQNYKKGKLIFIKGDLRDRLFIKDLFHEFKKSKQGIDAVIHFAGLKSTNESIVKPIKYWEANVLGTINLLLVMKEFACKKIVFSSSATIYNLDSEKCLSENSALCPINPYGNTKLCIETMLKDVSNAFEDFKVVNLRYFNPVGAHESGQIGEHPSGSPRNIFPIILKVASGEIESLPIYGNDYPTKDGTCVRDYIHVMDVADAHLESLRYLENTKESNATDLNIGTGNGNSVLELIKIFENVNNIKIPYYIAKRRAGDQPFVVADNTFAKKKLNWEPKRSIEQICKDGWKWWSSKYNI